MPQKTFKAPDISCRHCVSTIQRELGELPGVTSVHAEEATRQVQVSWEEPTASWQEIRDLLAEIGYPPEVA